MAGFTQPMPPEVCVGNVKPFRFTAENGKFGVIFNRLNPAMTDSRSSSGPFQSMSYQHSGALSPAPGRTPKVIEPGLPERRLR